LAAADDPKKAAHSLREADQAALKAFSGMIGPWKGTAQPIRNSAKGAWVESGDWAWSLTSNTAALKLTLERGKMLKSAVLKPGAKPKTFVLEATLADGSKRSFHGSASGDQPVKLVLVSEPATGDGPRRITLTPLHDTRFLMLLESSTDGERFQRLAEVGYTRQGVAFAVGDTAPVCVVTGGRGSTQVSYQGKTYWVCCSGCKDLFYENPKEILAEAVAKKRIPKP
jgi:YHS domain-containing protein